MSKTERKVFAVIFGIILVAFIAKYINPDLGKMDKIESEQIEKQKNNVISLPSKNIVELNELWKFKGDGRICRHATDDQSLYLQSEIGTYYVIDKDSLNLVKSVKYPYGDDESFYNLSASNGILAITSEDKVVVFDTKKEEILLDYKIKNSWGTSSLDMGVLLYDNFVIFSHGFNETTYAMNYNTGEVAWKHERGWKSGNIDLYRYKDRYLYEHTFSDAFYEFNPESGAIIGKYPYDFVNLANPDSDKHVDVVDIFESVEDRELRAWLEGLYGRTEKGDIYSIYKSRLHFHGQSLKSLWEMEFPNEIDSVCNYGRYMFLNLIDSIVLLDLEDGHGEILWNVQTEDNLIQGCFVHEERLYVSYENATVEVFDLSKLEK